jgi:hypothetical protein
MAIAKRHDKVKHIDAELRKLCERFGVEILYAFELEKRDVLSSEATLRLRILAGYRNRMVPFLP